MASENEASCESDPNFAVICGFLEKFSVTCGLANIDFVDLQEMLENTQEVSPELVELHVKLMRRARKSVSSNDRWERALIKTCHTFSSQDAWEIERFGYKKARISSKLRILKELLEMQFDYNQKFKNEINKISADELRTQPLGRDRLGRAYWYQCDESCQVRVYKDDPDEETWTLIAKDRQGLVTLISQLGNGDTTKSSSEPVSNEDSNSVEVEKPTLDTGQSKSSSPTPTKPETSDNMEEEKMDIDTECTETRQNIEENKLEESNSPSLPAKDDEKIVEEKVVESEKKVEEKIDAIKIILADTAKDKNEEDPVVDKRKDILSGNNKSIENNSEKLLDVERKLPVEEKFPVEDKLPMEGKLSMEEKLPMEEKLSVGDKLPMEEKLSMEDKLPVEEKLSMEEKLPMEEPCENALNLCSKDLSNKDDKEEKTGLDLSVKTGPCLRIKPITELMAEPQHSDMQKKEFMGIKGKYIRGDAMDKGLLYPNPTHLGKAVQSASYDAICYKRAMEDSIYSAPTSLKHPRFDKRGCIRPTLLVNKKYMSYMNDDDDDEDLDEEDDIEDEIEEPLMLVQGEGSGFPNESASDKIEGNPIVGEEVEEPVLYVFGEGSGKDCQTGNEYLKESQDNKKKETADNNADTSTKSQQLSASKSYKLGTIIDSKNDKVCPRNTLRKSRWDVTENSTENKRNTNENFLTDSKSDVSDVDATDSPKNFSSEDVASSPPQTFFFGSRSSFSPSSSPVKSASLSFGASTVSDNQTVDMTASVPSPNEGEEDGYHHHHHHPVEGSAAKFNLDDKTDQNLVGSNPSQTKVPEENVDIENMDNNIERLSVVENEKRDGPEESVRVSEHERLCSVKPATSKDVSDSKSSEIKEDSGEANSVSSCVTNDSTEESVKQTDATVSDSLDTRVSDSEPAKTKENVSTIPSDESAEVKNQTDIEVNQNLTAAVISKEDALSGVEKAEDSVTEVTSDEASDVTKSPEDVQSTITKSPSTEADEKVSVNSSEEVSANTHEECKSSESRNDAEEQTKSISLTVQPDACAEDNEVKDDLKSVTSESKDDAVINLVNEEKQENKAKPNDKIKNKEKNPSLATDTAEENEDISNSTKETPATNNSKEASDEAVKVVDSNSTNLKLSNNDDSNKDNKKFEINTTKCSEQGSANDESPLSKEDKTSNETKNITEVAVDATNVTSSEQQIEIENNNVEENDLSNEETKVDEEVNTEKCIKHTDEKPSKHDDPKGSNEESLQSEENKPPEVLPPAENKIEDVAKKANASCETTSSEIERNSREKDSEAASKEAEILLESRDNIEGNIEKTKKEIRPNNARSAQKKNNLIERKEPEDLKVSTSELKNEETHTVDPCVKTKNKQKNKHEKEETKEESSKQSEDDVGEEEKPKIPCSNAKETANKISRDLDPVVVIEMNNKESFEIENDDEAASKSGLDAIKAIKITSVQAKYIMPEKTDEDKNKSTKPSLTAVKKQITPPELQSLRFLRGRRPNQMLSVKSYATRNKNLVLRKETKPQIETNGKNIVKQQSDNAKKVEKDLPNNIDEHLAIAKIEEHVENNVRRSTRRKPADLVEKTPVIPQIKGRQKKVIPIPQEIKIKHVEEVDVRYSKRLRLSNNQVPIVNVETIDLTSESDILHKHTLKKNPIARRTEEVHLKGGLSIKPIYKETPKEEKKHAKKNGPFLTCVNIKKLKENPVDHVDSPLSVESSGGGDNSDVVIIEDDPLAVPDPYETSIVKPMTLSSFQLDVDYTSPSPPPPPIIITRSLRKRAITEPEIIMPTGGKRRKTKGKRQVDLELRRSIEEQKKQEISSSDEEKKEVSPKRKPLLYKPKKQEVEKDETPAVPKVKKPRAPKKKTLLGLDIPAAMEDIDAASGNIRQSRRIAQLKIKEEAERRKLDDITMRDHKKSSKKNKKNADKDYKAEKRKRPKPPIEEDIIIDVPVVEVEEKKKKRKRKRKYKDPRKIFDESNPWRSSSGSNTSDDEVEEEEEEIVEYSEAESPLFKSDHEFSPESDIEETGEPQPLKRARTARKEDAIEDDVDEHACQKCGKSDHPEWILLCDTCDSGWHCSCLRPALFIIPEGDWFCPPCQHNSLVKQLEDKLVEYDKKLAKREIENRRKERLAYVGISLANVLPVKDMDEKKKRKDKFGRDDEYEDDASATEESYSSSESSSTSDSDEPIYQLRQRRQAHSYRFNDYDDLINSAIQDEMEAVKGAGNQGRGKDILTIVNAEKEEQAENAKQELEPLPPVVPVETKELPPAVVPPEHNDSEEEEIKPMKKLIGRKKHRKLNSLDVSSGDDPDSDEDFKGSSSEEEEDDFEEDVGSDSSEAYGRRRRGMQVRRSTRARTSRYDRDFINDDSDEDEIPRKKKSRSAWEEDSESEESDKSWGRTSRRKTKRSSVPRKKRSKKSKKHFDDSEEDSSKKKKRRIKYGGLDDDGDDEEIGGRRTRGKKINYADVLATDSDEEVRRKAPPRIESDDDYVANEDQEEQDDEDYEKEENVEKEKTPERTEIEKEKTPERETSVPKEAEVTIPEPQPTTVPAEEESASEKVNPEPPQENFDLDNLNSSIDDLPDDLPDDNDEDDSGLNPIEEINKNLEEMDEAEMEKLMEEEEYANKQLQLMALQLEKEKKRKEREAKKKEMAAAGLDPKMPKKRGRKNKVEGAPEASNKVQIATLQVGPDMQSNAELSEPPGVTIPIFSEIPPSSVDGSPKKRRGRGKGKKTLEKEQAAAATAAALAAASSSSLPPSSISSEASDDQAHIPTTLDTVGNTNNSDLSLANAAAMHGAKLAIAAPPQPFSQTQPTPSVITRMMQNQPGQGNYSPLGMGHNYYADQPPAHAENSPTPPVSNSQMSACVPLSGNVNANNNPGQMPPMSQQQYMHGNPPRGMSSTVYRQPPPNINPYHRTSPAPPMRVRNPNPTPPTIPPVYHSHHPLDPSPSGGGPITVPPSSMNTPDRSSPVSIPPSSDSPLSNKSDPTPPPPPYSRLPIRFGNVNTTPPMASSPIRQQQSIIPAQHQQQHLQQQQPGPPRGNMPYHPASVPPNYYGGFMSANMGSEESLTPTGYHYSDQFSETNSPQDMGKGYDEENSGEFGGLVSYFSSQREDDLDT